MKLHQIDFAKKAAVATHGVSAFNEGAEPLPGLALGASCRNAEKDDWELLVIVQPGAEEAADKAVKTVGKSECKVIQFSAPIQARITHQFSKQHHRPLIIGQQIGPAGKNWVGTGGVFLADSIGGIYQLTNEHVVGMGARRGTIMNQGNGRYGIVESISGVYPGSGNLFDAALVRVDNGLEIDTLEHTLDSEIEELGDMTADMVNEPFGNTGRTIGTRTGFCVGFDLSNVAVSYDFGTASFKHISMFASPKGQDPFSAGGHSGSTIVRLGKRTANALLFAGGPGNDGVDYTFACNLLSAVRRIQPSPLTLIRKPS